MKISFYFWHPVHFLQCISSVAELLGERREERKTSKGRDPEFILNTRPLSAWGRRRSPVPIKLIGYNWFGTHVADIGRKVSWLFFQLVEVGHWARALSEDTAAFTSFVWSIIQVWEPRCYSLHIHTVNVVLLLSLHIQFALTLLETTLNWFSTWSTAIACSLWILAPEAPRCCLPL